MRNMQMMIRTFGAASDGAQQAAGAHLLMYYTYLCTYVFVYVGGVIVVFLYMCQRQVLTY